MNATWRHPRISALGALVLACASCSAGADAVGSSSQDQVAGEALPLREVSGLAIRNHQLVAVGDHSTDIVTFRLEDGVLADVVKHKRPPTTANHGSQYEAVSFDGKGNIVVVSETGSLTVLAPDCEREIASSTLDWLSANPFVEGRVELNSLAEGVVILSESHVLIALEKSPTALVEFGPPGEKPQGYSPGSPRAVAFAPPAELVALAAWKVDDKNTPDLSELTIGPDGALWALSQQGGTIVRFERTLRPDEQRASVKEHFAIPAEIEGAEGLAFDGAIPIVARDRTAKKKNVFVLAPLGS